MSNDLIIFLIVFGSASGLFLLIWLYVAWRIRRRAELLERRLASSDSDQAIVLSPPSREGWAARLDRGFEQMVWRTGLDLDPPMALAIIFIMGVLLAAAVFVWRLETEPWLAIPAFFLGAAVPLIFLLWREQTWRRTLQRQLPDAFFLLARSIRAGRSVDQAFQLIGDQGAPPLSREFARMYRQLELGLSLTQVLQLASDRLGLVDFNIFASTMSLHRTTGGNLPQLLDRLATATRDRNQFEGQYRAATVLGRYSAAFILVMVGIILFHLFFFQRDEFAMKFFDTTHGYTGIILFTLAIGLELLGGFLLYLFLRYEY